MRRSMRLLTLLAVATPSVLLATPGMAQAGTAKPGVLQLAWFWQTAYEQSNPPVAAGPAPTTEPSGVPKGDLAVAHTSNDGSSSKMSVLAFSLGSAAKTGSTIDSFTVSLTLDTSSGAANVGQATAPIVACLPTRLWSPADGGDYTNEPPVDCSSKVVPTVKGNTYTFAIPAIAQQWVGNENVGVGIVNDPANTSTPFQVVFSGAKSVTASMTYSPPLPPITGGSTGGGTTGGVTGSSAGTGTTGTGTTAAPPPSTPVNLPASGPATSTAPGAGQPPQVAPTGTPAPQAAPAALVKRAAPSAPNTAFWIGAAALALLVVGAALVLSDHDVPVPTATTTKLGLVLREREREQQREADPAPTATPTLALRRV